MGVGGSPQQTQILTLQSTGSTTSSNLSTGELNAKLELVTIGVARFYPYLYIVHYIVDYIVLGGFRPPPLESYIKQLQGGLTPPPLRMLNVFRVAPPEIYLSIHLSIYLSIYLSSYLSIYLSTYLSIYL